MPEAPPDGLFVLYICLQRLDFFVASLVYGHYSHLESWTHCTSVYNEIVQVFFCGQKKMKEKYPKLIKFPLERTLTNAE